MLISGRGARRQRRPVVRRSDQVFKAFGRCARRCAADQHVTADRLIRQNVPARGVADQGARATVPYRILELGPGPPGVQRHGDSAQGRDGEIDDGKFGQVAHGDRNPVAWFNATREQGVGQMRGGVPEAVKTDPLIIENHEVPVAVRLCGFDQIGQDLRSVLPHPNGRAIDLFYRKFEKRPRRAQLLLSGLRRKRGPFARAHHVSSKAYIYCVFQTLDHACANGK